MNSLNYLLGEVEEAPIKTEPFNHIEIEPFLSIEDFTRIVSDPQISIPKVRDNQELFARLRDASFDLLPFPGTPRTEEAYQEWSAIQPSRSSYEATFGFGMVYRLTEPRNPLLRDLIDIFKSDEMSLALARRFGIRTPYSIDVGIQKYLHGYEVSPHTDIRKKALTWILNLNPGESTDGERFHTSYLKFKSQWKFIEAFWEANSEVDRDNLPWDWFESVKEHTANNSIIIFAPGNNTIHAAQAFYNHFNFQRTLLFGNFWYDDGKILPRASYEDFEIVNHVYNRHTRKA